VETVRGFRLCIEGRLRHRQLGANMDLGRETGPASLDVRENFSNFPLASPAPLRQCPTVPLSYSVQWMDRRPTLDGTPPTSPWPKGRPPPPPGPWAVLFATPRTWTSTQAPTDAPFTWLSLFCCRSPHHPRSSKLHLSLICQCLDVADNIPPIQTLSSY